MRALVAALAAALLAAAACSTSFEDPTIVIDLRALSVTADPPEIVFDFDPDNPEDVELLPTEVCALVADPGASRRLFFEMSACYPTGDGRCTADQTVYAFGGGSVDDPDESPTEVSMCATLPAGPQLLQVVQEAIEHDSFSGFGGIPVQLEVFVRPVDGDDADGIYAAKRMLYSPRLPPERVANTNPALAELRGAREPNGERDRDFQVVPRRCADADAAPFEVEVDERIELWPVDADGARETYVVPTFDGGSREFTENLTYAWFATDGDWGAGNTGGPRDPFGNDPQRETTWRAPSEPGLVDMWTVVRDERYGQVWYPMCARVVAAD